MRTLTEQLKDPCGRCGCIRAKHVHAKGFCQGIKHGYVPCECEGFVERAEGAPGNELESKCMGQDFNDAR
jgi:hypothetical protein